MEIKNEAMRDVDTIIESIRKICPSVTVEQLEVLHPGADDDGLWFFRQPGSKFEVQIEAATEDVNMVELLPGFELVEVIYEYCDEPRSGLADYNGEPHWFEDIFDEEKDDYSDFYWLTPLRAESVGLLKQQTEIFLRWRSAFDTGEVGLVTHPALPQEAKEYEKLKAAIEEDLLANSHRKFKMRGEFKLLGPPRHSKEISAFQVKWVLQQ